MTKAHACEDKCRLVLVEDSEDDAALMQLFLERESIFIQTVRLSDGHSGYEYIKKLVESEPFQSCSLVLLDLNLPKMNGREILARLRKEHENNAVRIIVFSGSENPNDKKLCMELGAQGYYIKPWGVNAYRDFIRGPLKQELEQLCPTALAG